MTDAFRRMVLRDPDQSSPNSGNKCWLARPLILPDFFALGQTVYEKMLQIFLHPSVFWRPRGNFLGQSSLFLALMYSNPPLPSWQISSRSGNLSTRYPLPKFVNFDDGVTDTQKNKRTKNRYRLRIPCGDNKWKFSEHEMHRFRIFHCARLRFALFQRIRVPSGRTA